MKCDRGICEFSRERSKNISSHSYKVPHNANLTEPMSFLGGIFFWLVSLFQDGVLEIGQMKLARCRESKGQFPEHLQNTFSPHLQDKCLIVRLPLSPRNERKKVLQLLGGLPLEISPL